MKWLIAFVLVFAWHALARSLDAPAWAVYTFGVALGMAVVYLWPECDKC